MPEIRLRLSIYNCPAQSTRHFEYFRRDEEPLFRPTDLGEEIYVWATECDIWGGVADEELRQRLRESLLSFDGSGKDGHRTISDLWPVLEQLESAATTDNWALTAVSRQGKKYESESESALHIPPTLTFAHHLRWLCETFGQSPDLVVVVR